MVRGSPGLEESIVTSITSATIFQLEDHGHTQTLWLEAPHQSVQVMDRLTLDRLDATIDAIEAAPPEMLLIRSRDDRVWVAGADLKEIDGLDDLELDAYLAEGQRVLRRLSELPIPVIAGVTGACLGGGLELALHCHGIIATTLSMRGKPYPIGLPEASLGLIPGWGGTQLLPARVEPSVSVSAIASGTPFSSDAMPEGLVDVTVEDAEAIMPAAISLAQSLNPSTLPPAIASCEEESLLAETDGIRHRKDLEPPADVIAHCIATGVKDGIDAGLAMEREGLVSLRNTEHTRNLLQAFLSRGH